MPREKKRVRTRPARRRQSVLFTMGGLCGIDIRALTYIPEHFIEPVNDHHVRTLPLPTLLQRIYAEFDAAESSDGDDDGDSDGDGSSSDERPRKRARRKN